MTKAPNPIDKYVGSRVRMQRMLRGLSQEKLGEALGVTFQQVQKYEKGANRIGASRLQEISRILDVSPSFFFEGLPTDEQPRPPGFEDAGTAFVTDFLSTSEGLQLNKSFLRLKDARIRKVLVDLVAALADLCEGRSSPERVKRPPREPK